MLIIYNQKDLENLEHYINNLIENKELLSLLESDFTVYTMKGDSKEAKEIININKGYLIIPCCLFMYNPEGHKLIHNQKIIIEKIVLENNIGRSTKLRKFTYSNLSNNLT
jgi:hypothetical protein